jgi:hypothetical protein
VLASGGRAPSATGRPVAEPADNRVMTGSSLSASVTAEAGRLYARHGYREVAPFNDGRWADRWLEKALA